MKMSNEKSHEKESRNEKNEHMCRLSGRKEGSGLVVQTSYERNLLVMQKTGPQCGPNRGGWGGSQGERSKSLRGHRDTKRKERKKSLS